jgi:prophage tail gpP-like protein
VYGVNIKGASGIYTDADRFSAYEVKGDAGSDGGGWGASTVAIAAKSADAGVKRYRYKLLKATEAMTSSLAQKKANWEAQIRAGRAGEVSVQVVGWRQNDGQLWRINEIVPVDIAPLLIQKTSLLITRTMYRQDAGGTVCDITLKRPDVYAPDPTENVKKAKTDSVWG